MPLRAADTVTANDTARFLRRHGAVSRFTADAP